MNPIHAQQLNSSPGNPFIPLQAARKSTKGKEKEVQYQKPIKDVRQKVEEPPKKEVPKVAQTTINTQSLPQPSDQIKKETVKSNPETRKSRLAIKF